jgi:hypothetical protein
LPRRDVVPPGRVAGLSAKQAPLRSEIGSEQAKADTPSIRSEDPLTARHVGVRRAAVTVPRVGWGRGSPGPFRPPRHRAAKVGCWGRCPRPNR